jgi:DNA-binding NarL/FixJ family response regulator
LLDDLVRSPANHRDLRRVLTLSQDYDLAARAGLDVERPKQPREPLSPREREVLQLLRRGLTNKQIAEALFIAESTAKVHVRHILDKIGARTRTEAATRVDLN